MAALASHTLGGLSGFMAQALGWTLHYTVAMFSAVPSMVLMLIILRRFPPEKQARSFLKKRTKKLFRL